MTNRAAPLANRNGTSFMCLRREFGSLLMIGMPSLYLWPSWALWGAGGREGATRRGEPQLCRIDVVYDAGRPFVKIDSKRFAIVVMQKVFSAYARAFAPIS